MPEQEASATSSAKNVSVPVPWWVRLCRGLWRVLLFVWGTLVLNIIVGTIANLNTTTTDTSLAKLYIIHVVITYPFPAIVGAGTLLLLTIISWIGSRKQKPQARQVFPNEILQETLQGSPPYEDKEVLRRYLATVMKENEYLEPINIPQSPQRLISFSAPLDKVFIRLRAVYDRPLYDIGRDLRQLIEKLQQYLVLSQELKDLELNDKDRQKRIQQLHQELEQLGLSAEDRQELIQQLRQRPSPLWLSQVLRWDERQIISREKKWQELLEKLQHRVVLNDDDREELRRFLQIPLSQRLVEGQEKQDITIEAVLQKLDATKPVAIILGSPGSGKSTSMRWLARQMAYAYDSTSPPLKDYPQHKSPSY